MSRNNRRRHGSVIRIHEEQKEDLNYARKKKVKLIPRNIAQEDYVFALHDPSQRIVFALGPAGTGKTYLACQKAVAELNENRVKKIVITRPAVEAGERLGYLPGTLEKKLEPWCMPVLDVFAEYYSQKEIKTMIEEKVVEIAPLAYMRGRNFRDSFIILDEAQNTTPEQMKMALTRISTNTKMVVTGDIRQSDIRGSNGLSDILQRYNTSPQKNMSLVTFTKEHVERDYIVKSVLNMYGEDD